MENRKENDQKSKGSTYDDMVKSLEHNQTVFDFVAELNKLKKNGDKSFGVMSLGYPELQHRVLIASSALLHKFNVKEKLGVVVNSRSVLLQQVIKESTSSINVLADKEIPYYNFHNKFDLTLLSKINEEHSIDKDIEYSGVVHDFNAQYDTVLWDLPMISDIQQNYEHYMPILDGINHIFLVLSGTGSTSEEIKKIQDYFANFNVKISGILLNASSQVESKWWQFWKS